MLNDLCPASPFDPRIDLFREIRDTSRGRAIVTVGKRNLLRTLSVIEDEGEQSSAMLVFDSAEQMIELGQALIDAAVAEITA